MGYAQQCLSDFLYAEFLHSIGSYRAVASCLEQQIDRRARDGDEVLHSLELEWLQRVLNYNIQLRDNIHRSGGPNRHPDPGGPRPAKQGSNPEEFVIQQSVANSHEWLFRYYSVGAKALSLEPGARARPHLARLQWYLLFLHDSRSQESSAASQQSRGHRREGKRARYENRYRVASKYLPLPPGASFQVNEQASEGDAELILQSCLETQVNPFAGYLIRAFIDTHFRMHYVEYLLSGTFEQRIRERDALKKTVDRELNVCLVMNTFVYAVSRSARWLFAEDDEERRDVLEKYESLCQTSAPSSCGWLAEQVCLLALYRRAYTYALLGDKQKAYNDYHKVQHLIRIATRKIRSAAVSIQNSLEFLAGLDALSEHHIGELYRSDHAHTVALEHFCKAHDRLEQLGERTNMRGVLVNSRWRIRLMLSQGKAFYEVGNLKRALKWYTRAWRAFLELVADETGMELHLDVVNKLDGWLTSVKNEPDFSKAEATRYLEEFVDQLSSVQVSPAVRGLAADILLRFGHLLFILQLGKEPANAKKQLALSDLHGLAQRCVKQAFEWDPSSTLAASDLLKIKYCSRLTEAAPPMASVADQWPGGGGDFERGARVIEHLLLLSVAEAWPEGEAAPGTGLATEKADKQIATSLLSYFLSHTDSINVKMSQVYRYLMQGPARPPELASREPFIEFISMKRYSSFFPFLPRPSAFRVRGGGYFLRVYASSSSSPLGIVVDPGGDFIEGLHRCGYSLADIDAVIVSHDHADHIASLDAILSLLGYRINLRDTKFKDKATGKINKKLEILGNDGVFDRYKFFNGQGRLDAVRVRNLKKFTSSARAVDGLPGCRLRAIVGMSHLDLRRTRSLGFVLSVEGGPSVAFTGDTGRFHIEAGRPTFTQETEKSDPRERGVPVNWRQHWKDALQADVLVANIGSVPLTQLRQLAFGGDSIGESSELQARIEEFEEIWGRVQSSREESGVPSLTQQFNFSFWLTSGEKVLSPVGRLGDTFWPPKRHLYLAGLLEFAKAFKKIHKRKSGLLVVGELREEMGTFRSKVAQGLNARIFSDGNCWALTGDIGLKVRVEKNRVSVLCSTCELDNDLTPPESYHVPRDIREVCVKGENEGIFYNCHNHDPSRQAERTFLERMERYDVFGR